MAILHFAIEKTYSQLQKKVFQIIAIFSPSKRMFLFKHVLKFLFRYNCAIVKISENLLNNLFVWRGFDLTFLSTSE